MERSKALVFIFHATIILISVLWPTGAGELSGSDPWAGPFWPEPVLRTRACHLRTDWSGRTDRTNGKRPENNSWPCNVRYGPGCTSGLKPFRPDETRPKFFEQTNEDKRGRTILYLVFVVEVGALSRRKYKICLPYLSTHHGLFR